MGENTGSSSAKRTKLFVKSLLYYLPISAILIFIDQLTKHLVNGRLEEHESIVLVDGVFEIYYLRNPFASFNLGKSFPQFFYTLVIIFSIVFIALLIYFMMRVPPKKEFRLLQVILILFFAGTVGNFIDRVLYHSVIDFLYFKAINFPVFNVADIFVVCAAVLFVISFLFFGKLYEKLFPDKKKKKGEEDAAGQAVGESGTTASAGGAGSSFDPKKPDEASKQSTAGDMNKAGIDKAGVDKAGEDEA